MLSFVDKMTLVMAHTTISKSVRKAASSAACSAPNCKVRDAVLKGINLLRTQQVLESSWSVCDNSEQERFYASAIVNLLTLT